MFWKITKITIGLLGILLSAVLFVLTPFAALIFAYNKIFWAIDIWAGAYILIFCISVGYIVYTLIWNPKEAKKIKEE